MSSAIDQFIDCLIEKLDERIDRRREWFREIEEGRYSEGYLKRGVSKQMALGVQEGATQELEILLNDLHRLRALTMGYWIE